MGRTVLIANLLLLIAFRRGPAADAQQPATFKARPPELEEHSKDDWINSKPLKLKELYGHVVILHFWTFGCVNCIHNQPTYKAWHEKYSSQGVVMIGVHTPETERERQLETVRESSAKRGLKYPIVFDKDCAIWKAWDNRWWPSTYLIDKEGFVRYRWDGELNWKGMKGAAIMEKKIDQLLAEGRPVSRRPRDVSSRPKRAD